jgi:valyl-tRNA synthetase
MVVDFEKLSNKLAMPGYTDKAPAHLVEKDKIQLADFQEKIQQLQTAIAKLA